MRERTYVPSKRIKAAHREYRRSGGGVGLREFATENRAPARVVGDWLHNKKKRKRA